MSTVATCSAAGGWGRSPGWTVYLLSSAAFIESARLCRSEPTQNALPGIVFAIMSHKPKVEPKADQERLLLGPQSDSVTGVAFSGQFH
jgi:hypothetical protein